MPGSARTKIGLSDTFWQRVKRHLESGAETPATALRLNCAMVKINQMLRNREAQAKPTKLPGHRSISLLKRSEQRSQPLRFNSDAVVRDVEMEPATLVVVGADGDLSTLWREFHRVVDQIPKDLLKPN